MEPAQTLALARPVVVNWQDGRTLRAVTVLLERHGHDELLAAIAPCVQQAERSTSSFRGLAHGAYTEDPHHFRRAVRYR